MCLAVVERSAGGRLGTPCQIAPRNPEGTVNGFLDTCGPYLCLQERCRSCLSDAECSIEIGRGSPSCVHLLDDAERAGNTCGNDLIQAPVGEPLAGPTSQQEQDSEDVPDRLTVEVVAVHPHATDAQTQGLLMVGSDLFESTGGEGVSQLRLLAKGQADPILARDLEPTLYGEGLAFDGENLVQLTYEAGRALVWSLPDLTPAPEMAFEGPGWGLCHDGERFIMSDGTGTLQILATEDFELIGTLQVELPELGSVRLNELECTRDAIFANVFEYREILRISPQDGQVTAVIDTRNLLRHPEVPQDQLNWGGQSIGDLHANLAPLNGIARDPATGHLLLTGKKWPVLFEVRLIQDDLFR